MAQGPPFSDVVLDSKRQRSDETVHSEAAKAAITAMAVELCDGMESLSVAVKLHAKGLLSGNTLEAVRDFQEVKEAKNSRILQNVTCAITVAGLQGFQDFLSVLGTFQLLRSLVTDLQESYQEHLQDNQSWNHQNRLFWEQQREPVPSTMHQQMPPLPPLSAHSAYDWGHQRHSSACLPPCTCSSYPVTAQTPLPTAHCSHRLQPMPTNHLCHDEHATNREPQHEQSKLLSFMPSPGAHRMGSQLPAQSCWNVVSYSNPWPLHSNSAPLCVNPGPSHFSPLYSADDGNSKCCSMERPIMALENQQPIPSQSSPPLQSVNGSHLSALTGLTLEQSASSPSPFSTNQPAWQQQIRLRSEGDRRSPLDSGVYSLLSSSSMTGHSDSIVEQFSRYSEGLSHSPQQPAIPPHMCEVLPSGSSSSSGGSSLEKQENSKKLHRQKSFDKGSVKQRSRTDSMDSGITGSQASQDNDDSV